MPVLLGHVVLLSLPVKCRFLQIPWIMFYNNDHKCVLEFLPSKFIDGRCCRNVDTQMQCCIMKYGLEYLCLLMTRCILSYGEAFGFGLGLDKYRSSRCHNVRLSRAKFSIFLFLSQVCLRSLKSSLSLSSKSPLRRTDGA